MTNEEWLKEASDSIQEALWKLESVQECLYAARKALDCAGKRPAAVLINLPVDDIFALRHRLEEMKKGLEEPSGI